MLVENHSPLSFAVRTLELSPLKIKELIPREEVKPELLKKGKKPDPKEAPAE